MKRVLVVALISCFYFNGLSSSIDKGYEALHVYDYFKAKSIFYKQLKKHPAEAGYGLSVIYYRNDNPFHQLDSAYKYIASSRAGFTKLSLAQKNNIKTKYHLNDTIVNNLHDSICEKAYQIFLKKQNVESAEKYIEVYKSSLYSPTVFCKRDSLIFFPIKNIPTVNSLTNYIHLYPQSCYLNIAFQMLTYATYLQITAPKNDTAYLTYIKNYPKEKYAAQAKDDLLAYYITHKNTNGVYYYIKKINPSYYAWNALFSLEVKNYAKNELELFLSKYPDYPEKNQVEEEFTNWLTPLFLIKHNNKFGYIDSSGKTIIEPSFDYAEDFSEGYATIEKDSLYGYINKVGRIKINCVYNDASSFQQQIAVVTKDKDVYLIDHSAKKISDKYDEISDFSDNMAIVKSNNLFGAINRSGQEIIKTTYAYLSDFSEGLSSFMQNNKYGFVNKQGFVTIAPVFNWVGSFKNNLCRVKIDNHLGVINKQGNFVIQPIFDLIDEQNNGIYVVVKNNLYGFMDTSGCYLSEVKYNYNPSLKTIDLTNGKFMRLLKNNKEELQDINGVKYFSAEKFSVISLPSEDVVTACKNNKYGFYNLNGKSVSAVKKLYTLITNDKKYWYCKNDKGIIVYNLRLKEKLFSIEADEVSSLNNNYFLYETDNGTGLLNAVGKPVIEAYFDKIIPTQNSAIFYIERKEKGAYFNVNALQFIWQENGFNAAYIADEE